MQTSLLQKKSINLQKKPDLKEIRRKIKRDKYLLMMFLPCLIFLFIFHYIPMYGVILAFKEVNPSNILGGKWVGFQYFRFFFTYMDAWKIIWNTLIINIYDLFLFPAPIILALIFNEIRVPLFKKLSQTISYVPHFVSTVVIIGMMVQALSPTTGWINQIISSLGFEPIYFWIKPEWFRTLYLTSGLWQGIGWSSIIYMAAIAGVDVELYDAAVIDGAGRWKQTIHITIPSIMNVIILLLILRVGSMFSVGTEKVLLMQNDLNMQTSDVLGTFLYRVGFRESNFSLGTAVGLMNSVVSMLMILAVNQIARKYSESSLF